MVSLKTAGLRFNSTMFREDGLPFQGTIEPDLEGKLIGYDFSFPRRILRVSEDCVVNTGNIIRDVMSRHYLVADHDGSFARNIVEYRSHMLIPLNTTVRWKRETDVVDQLTQRKKSSGTEELGTLRVLIERVNREMSDSTMRVKEEAVTCFTAAALQLNDIIEDKIVKRVNIIRGVYLAELQ